MYTTINVERDAEGVFFREVRELCDRSREIGKTDATYSPGIFVCYDADGMAITFDTRLYELPVLMRDVDPLRVKIKHKFSAGELATVVNRSWVTDSGWGTVHSITSPMNQVVEVTAPTLQLANRLYDAIMQEADLIPL